MKKVYMLMALLLLSGVIFSQNPQKVGKKQSSFKENKNNHSLRAYDVQSQKSEGKTLSAVKVINEINNLHYSSSKAVVDSLNYDSDNDNALGTGDSTNIGVYSYFPAATLAPHATAGHYILSVKLYIDGISDVLSSELRFYSDQGTTLVYSQDFTPIEGWNEVFLTSPYQIPSSGNIYIGYYLSTSGGYPAGCDAGPENTNGNWIDLEGTWQHLTDIDATLTFNWNIRAMCGHLPTTPVASCSPLAWNAGILPITTSAISANITLTNVGIDTLTCNGISGLSNPFTTTFVPDSISLINGDAYTFTFTYSPTVVANDSQTIVISTNGGNITINLTGKSIDCEAITTFPWIESFEGTYFPPDCWSKANPDAGSGWEQIASGTTPLPGWTGGTMTTPIGGGNNATYCTYSTGGSSSNDQWLISPQIAVQTGQELSFFLYWFGHYQDLLDIKISTTTNDASSFTTTLLSTDTLQYIHGDWKYFNISLSAYAGQNVYIAFNEHVADNYNEGAFLAIDMVKVDAAPTTPVAYCSPISWNANTIIANSTVTSGTFTLTNVGASTLTCSVISGLSAPFTTTLIPASVNLASGASSTFTFSYNPTVVATDNQTVIIATNGGNITINLSGNAYECNAISTFPWIESFEDSTFAPSCWTIETPDGGTGWDMISSGVTPLPGWNGGTMTTPTGGGSSAAYCTWKTGGSSSNNQWLITRQIAVENNQELSFYIYWYGHYQDYLDVKISTTTNAISSFTTTLLSTDTSNYLFDGWKIISIPLSTYAGQNVFFAFNEHVVDNYNDGAFIGIDLVKVGASTAGINEYNESLINVFPNPVKNEMNIISSTKIDRIKLINVFGQIVLNSDVNSTSKTINTSSFAEGMYFLQIENKDGIVTKNVTILK